MVVAVRCVAAGAALAIVGGCTASAEPAPVRQVRPVATSAQPTPSTPSTTASTAAPGTTTSTPAATAPPAPMTSPALATALDRLAADSRALRANEALVSVRDGVAAGLATGRKALQVTRAAAYPSTTRNCAQVAAGRASAQSGAAAVARAAAALSAAAAARQSQLSRLNASVAEVRRLLAVMPAQATSPTRAEVGAAVGAAAAQSAQEAAGLAATRAATADGLARSREMAASAVEIHSKVCG